MNPLLYGHNPKQRIVAVQQLTDKVIRLYQRIEGKIQQEDVEFFPFFFLSDPSLLRDFPKQFWLKELNGDLFYNHVAAFNRWSEMWEAVHFVIKSHNRYAQTKASNYNELESVLLKPDPVYQFLIQSGMTLFKGMEFDELHRMQIEVQRNPPLSPVKGRAMEDRPARIVLSDNRGWCDSIEGAETGEKEMMAWLISTICTIDPDVLEGHDLTGEILPSLASLCDRHSIDFAIGRDGSSLKHFSPRQPFWAGEGEVVFYEVTGRHLIDTLRLAEQYDEPLRSVENLQLDYLAQYFGLDPSPVHQAQNSPRPVTEKGKDPRRKAPSFDNVQRVRILSEILSLSSFYLTQMCPFNFGTILRIGSVAKIESLLLREYLRQRHSIPKPGAGSQSRGGYTDIFCTGVFTDILHTDVESLYPSIIISQGIKPKSDILNVFNPILGELTSLRLGAKRALKQTESPRERSQFNALQSAFKVLINSFYGYLAYSRALFNDYDQADGVATLGQTYLREIIGQARLFNAQVVEVDTDGLFLIPPDNVVGNDAEQSFVGRLASSLPTGINLVLAGRYSKMFSYKKKNYALKESSGKTVIKGSSLISRSLETFARQFVEHCIECILNNDFGLLHRTYTNLYNRIVAHRWHVQEFCRTESIKEELESYEAALRLGKRLSSAPVEAAKKASLYPRPGLAISYYVTGSEANVKVADNSRIASEWDANLPDENTAYYLGRLGECSAKFKDFFKPGDYEKIFTTDDLFGFDPSGIAVLNHELQPQKPEVPPEEHDDGFPIWLGDSPS